jgi:glycosyltransferase involved in cell wall biosynthesis
MDRKLKIAFIVPDNRDEFRRYDDPAPHFGTAPTALLDGFARLADDCEIHVVNCVQHPAAVPEKIATNIFCHTEIVPKWGWLRGGYLGCIRSVRRQLRRIQPDIVHGQGTERYCSLAAVFSGFPNVLTIHGNMRAIAEIYHARPCSFHWLAARLETVALRRTAGVFCNSAYTEKLAAPRAPKTWRVSNALRSEFFLPTTAAKPAAAPVILNIGVAEPRKQQVELLAVARQLHGRGFKFEMQFAGSLAPGTAYGAALARALAEAEAAGYARHLGNLSTAQLIVALDAAAALVHFPSEEAFGLVVAEALARNLKVFGAATGGVVDIATGVEGAELIAPQDFSGLETAIASWFKAGSPRPKNAAALMQQRYQPPVIARQHLAIYREVLTASESEQNTNTMKSFRPCS